MATSAKHRGNTPDPKVVKSLFDSLLGIADEEKELSARKQQIKIDASTDHNITTRSINAVDAKIKKIMKTGQLEFDDLCDETDVLWEALIESGFRIPEPEKEPDTNTEDDNNVVALDGNKENEGPAH